MGFGRELKDFVSGFQTGYKLMEDAEDNKSKRAYRKAATDKLNRENEDLAGATKVRTDAQNSGGDRSAGSNARLEDEPSGGGRRSDDGPLPGSSDERVKEVENILKVARRDSGEDSYNALTYGGKQKSADLTNMTLDEIDAFQAKMPSQGHASTALGGYQFIRPTLQSARKALGLSGDTKFTPEVQDQLAAQLVRGRGYDDFKAGRIDADKFARNLSQEWAILPMDKSGRGFYDGQNGNKAAVGWDEVMGALKPAPTQMAAPATSGVPVTPASPGGTASQADAVLANPSAYDPGTVEWAKKAKGQTAALPIEQVGLYAASGGMVEELDVEDPVARVDQDVEDPVMPQSAINLEGTPDQVLRDPTAGQSPAATREVRQSELLDIGGLSPAVDSGLKYIGKAFGFNQARPAIGAINPQADEQHRAFANNAGAAEPDEIEAVHRTVDPSGRLTDDQRHIAGFNAVYKYWMDKGEPEKAAKAMGGMLMAQRRAISMDGTMAMAAHEKGDIQGMVDAVVSGKNRIPDGESVRATKITKTGVEFEIVDNNGKVKQKGAASMDDMVNLAHQMQSGKAWFDQITALPQKTAREREVEGRTKALEGFNEARAEKGGDGFLESLNEKELAAFKKLHPTEQERVRDNWTAAERSRKTNERADAKTAKADSEEKAVEDYNREEINRDTDFMASMPDSQREAFINLPEKVQQKRRADWYREKQARAQDERFQLSREDRLSKVDADQSFREYQQLAKEGNWENNRDDKMFIEELRLAQRMREEAGRGERQELSFEERRKRNADIDARIIQDRIERQKRTGTVKPNAAERKVNAINDETAADYADIANRPGTSAVPISVPATADGMPGYDTTETRENYGPTLGQKSALDLATARGGYRVATAANKPDRKRIDEDAEVLGATFDDAWTKEDKKLDPVDKLAYVGAANSIREANPTITIPEAALMARTAADPRAEPKVLDDGRVQLHPKLTPVFISEPALRQLEALRQRAGAVTSTGNGAVNVSQPAQPGSGPAPATALGSTEAYALPEVRRAQEREAQRTARLKATEDAGEARREGENAVRHGNERQQLMKVLGQENYEALVERSPGGVVTLGALRAAADQIERTRSMGKRSERMQRQNRALRGIPLD